jgi:hypothetical protein
MPPFHRGGAEIAEIGRGEDKGTAWVQRPQAAEGQPRGHRGSGVRRVRAWLVWSGGADAGGAVRRSGGGPRVVGVVGLEGR